MARLNVTPTRMSLGIIKRKLSTASRGYRLLKDKRDELIRRTAMTEEEISRLEGTILPELEGLSGELCMLLGEIGEKGLKTALSLHMYPTKTDASTKNIMGTNVPSLASCEVTCAPFLNERLDILSKNCLALLPDLLKLSELIKCSELLSREANSASRRVNALENVIIPDYLETSKYIRMRLEENERANSIRLLKVKDMIIEEKYKQKQ